jgi:hypothetical protein
VLRWVISEPGGPTEAERAVYQGLVAADRDVGADWKSAQLSSSLTCLQLCSIQLRIE